jgi:type IX secretion system PorP/SprF family membrane protein
MNFTSKLFSSNQFAKLKISKFIIGFCLFIAFTVSLKFKILAQQEALYVTYPLNPLAINPAYAGSSGIASISILVRKQSLVLQNVGSSQYLSYNTPLASGKAGLGFQAYNSNFGQIGTGGTGFNLSGVYRHHFTDSVSISFGAQVGLAQVPSLFSGVAEFKPNIGLGLYFRTYNSYLGLSAPVVTHGGYSISKTDKYYYPRSIYLTAGHVLQINENFDLKFGAMLRQKLKEANISPATALDLNAVIWFKKAVGFGVYKNSTGSEVNPKDALIFSLEGQINQKFRLGFSFDAASKGTATRINPVTGRSSSLGLYNLMLRYDFDNLTGKINNFRFF